MLTTLKQIMSLLCSNPLVAFPLKQSDSKVVSMIYRPYRIRPLSPPISLISSSTLFPTYTLHQLYWIPPCCSSNISSLLPLRGLCMTYFLCLGISPSLRYPHGSSLTSFWSLLHSHLNHMGIFAHLT